MSSKFSNCSNFNVDLGNWNISAVTTMDGMFSGSPMDNNYNIVSSRTLAGWFNRLNSGVSGVPTAPTITEPIGWPGNLFDNSLMYFWGRMPILL